MDYMVGACYAGAVFGIVVLINGGRIPNNELQPLEAQRIGFLVLTIPVVLYFAICESARWQATLGKRLLGLRVQHLTENRLSFGKSLIRACLKFLPWEFGHTFVHQLVYGTEGVNPSLVPLWAWMLLFVSLLLDVWYLITLCVGSGRTPYDRASAAQVVVTPS